jgi:hypothetical protein
MFSYIISVYVGFLYTVNSNFVLLCCIVKIQEVNGVVLFFLNSEVYTFFFGCFNLDTVSSLFVFF